MSAVPDPNTGPIFGNALAPAVPADFGILPSTLQGGVSLAPPSWNNAPLITTVDARHPQDPLTTTFHEIASSGRHPFGKQLYRGSQSDGTSALANAGLSLIQALHGEYRRALPTHRTPEEAFAAVVDRRRGDSDAFLISLREILHPGSVDYAKVPRHLIIEVAQKFGAYDTVLGDFLPKPLHDLVKPVRSEMAYDAPSSETSRYRDDVTEYLRRLNHSRELGGGTVGISSGCSMFDDLTGGFSGTTVVGGNSGAGKTDFLISCVASILRSMPDVAILILSADLAKQRMLDRLMCCLAQISEAELYQSVRANEVGGRLKNAVAVMTAASKRFQVLEIDDHKPFDALAILRLRDELIYSSQCKRLLIVVDYLQVLRCTAPTGDLHEAERHRFGEITRLAKPSPWNKALGEFPLVMVSEVRKGDGNGGLELEDLSGSARHYFGADNVLLLETPAEGSGSAAAKSVPINFAVKKARRGHKGQFQLIFDYPLHSFRFTTPKPAEGQKTKRPRPAAV